jgi:hypothetical protein
MTPEDWMALGSFLTVTSAALALIIKQLEQSRCTKLQFCCMKCDRTVPDQEDPTQTPFDTARPIPPPEITRMSRVQT